MAWNKGWDDVFKKNEWGRYPSEELVRFIAKTFRGISDRGEVKILEVGCGTGANAWYLAREGFKTFGIDGSQVAIDRLRKRLDDEKLTADIRKGDITVLPYQDNYFDCVIDVECLYANSLKDAKVILKEIRRVIKPGGMFFSQTFMTGTYGDGNGELLEGEAHTYTRINEGAMHQGYGIIRFLAREEIEPLFADFVIKNIGYIIRCGSGRDREVKEWLITCQKG